MKRSLLVLTAAAVALSPVAASAAPAKATKRTISYDYAGAQAFGANGVGSASSENGCEAVRGCWDFETVKGEKTIEIKASDPSVGLQVFVDDNYSAGGVSLFCGGGKITVSPKSTHTVSVRTSLQDCPGVPTNGKLTATILGTK